MGLFPLAWKLTTPAIRKTVLFQGRGVCIVHAATQRILKRSPMLKMPDGATEPKAFHAPLKHVWPNSCMLHIARMGIRGARSIPTSIPMGGVCVVPVGSIGSIVGIHSDFLLNVR